MNKKENCGCECCENNNFISDVVKDKKGSIEFVNRKPMELENY